MRPEVAAAMEVDITMLGGCSIRLDGAEVDPAEWRRKQAAAIVKVLALTPRRTLHRELLIDQLWPELTLEDAAPRLHKAAHYARRALGGPGSLVLANESVALLPQDQVRVDALEFERTAEAARAAEDAALAALVQRSGSF